MSDVAYFWFFLDGSCHTATFIWWSHGGEYGE